MSAIKMFFSCAPFLPLYNGVERRRKGWEIRRTNSDREGEEIKIFILFFLHSSVHFFFYYIILIYIVNTMLKCMATRKSPKTNIFRECVSGGDYFRLISWHHYEKFILISCKSFLSSYKRNMPFPSHYEMKFLTFISFSLFIFI